MNHQFSCAARSFPQPHQAFLRTACDESAIAAENLAAVEAARMPGPGAVADIEQPVIGAKILMQPDGMIETGGLEIARHPVDPVR